MGCGHHTNPLQRGGTGQQDRLLPAMNTHYARVDEHSVGDAIFFAGEFSRFLHYYDGSYKQAGDWTPFFTSDVSAHLAGAAIQNIGLYRQAVKQRFDFLKSDDHRGDTAGLKAHFNDLLSALFTLSKALDDYTAKLPDDLALKNTLLNLVQSKLSFSLHRLLGYFRAAAENFHYLDAGLTGTTWRILNQEIIPAADLVAGIGFGKNWWVVKGGNSLLNYAWLEANRGAVSGAPALLASIGSWADYVASVAADESIFSSALVQPADPEAVRVYRSLQHAANHNLFTGIFDQYLAGYTKLVADAGAALEQTLTNRDSHQPHYALFLAFLKLFQTVQQSANTLTKRHLDFYYNEVLRLQPKPAVANKVHLLVTLAKQVSQHILVQGTRLKAGKDSKGKDVVYTLDADYTFSKAAVVELKSFYMATEADSVKDYSSGTPVMQQANDGRLFAAPIANSADGLGASIITPLKEWHPFANREWHNGAVTRMAMPKAEVGFAFASHYLHLAEGARTILIKLVTDNNSLLQGALFDCYVTTEKEWLKTPAPEISMGTFTNPTTTQCVQVKITLNSSHPALIPFDAAVHGSGFEQLLPVIKLVLRHDDLQVFKYNSLRNLTVSKVEIRVEVGGNSGFDQSGIKDLQLAGDTGTFDAAKPFQPFGAQPKKQASLIISNKEIFSKKNTALRINLDWAHLPAAKANIKYSGASDADTSTPGAEVSFLNGGIWGKNGVTGNLSLFDTANKPQVSLGPLSVPDAALSHFAAPYLPLNSNSKTGFVKLALDADFGHTAYQEDRTIHLINASKTDAAASKFTGVEPYTPVVQSIYLSYTAWQVVDLTVTDKGNFQKEEIRFFHLHPFGVAEQHNYLNQTFSNVSAIYLLPQFRFAPVAGNRPAEFYIGLEQLHPNEVVNILFQVLEGSTDPRVAKPGNHVRWSYLSNNFWIDFKDQDVVDATLGLLQSGIISFFIPPDATNNNTLLPQGKLWLRASIAAAADAVAKLLGVFAQAARATFLPQNNAPDFLDAPMAAGTITRLEVPDAAVKKVVQPFPAFGGRAKESENHYYLRVSERLRHKGRAVSIWDYEHLILEAFPAIYKVKCLNHTGIVQDGGVEQTNELKPGSVLIITIPSLKNRNDAHPLRPYTNQDTLTRIEHFIRQKVSPFVVVAARHPLFEEVAISFSLQLKAQYRDFTFYSRQLQEEIVRFLTPWAYDGHADIQFGGKVYKSALINFIEERYYVEYITNVVLHHYRGSEVSSGADMEIVTASTARSILVSVPAERHSIVAATLTPATNRAECAPAI